MATLTGCHHPHKRGCHGGPDLTAIPTTPLDYRCVLILYTEAGPVPYCGLTNQRAYAAADQLGKRHLAAGTISTYAIARDEDEAWAEQRYALPQLVLAHALAVHEERFCVAEWAQQKIVEGRY